ncbi:DUF6531 domain-containing protein [Rothia sp. CCM 9416]|uniref:DUF6531 domain-containing protein n=1 Tax=Rothia sp. CCM 9416 TaxID=3402655 RepID=UPI003AED93FF
MGPPSTPINKSAPTPDNTPRQTPSPGNGRGGGGTTSAIPENLRAFSTGLEPLDTEVKGKKTSLDTAYADFQGSCNYGSLDAAGAIGAIDIWLEKNAQDIRWAHTLAQAFEDAGAHAGHPVPLADSALATALNNAGVSAIREDMTVVNPSAVGGQPTSGYTLDPVNTGNGNFIEPENDLSFAGACSALALTRMYNSRGETGGVFGPGWSSVLDTALIFDDEQATWAMHDGRKISFARSGEGFLPCADENFWLVPVADASTVLIPEVLSGRVAWVVANNTGSGWFFTAAGDWLGSAQGPGTGVYVDRDRQGEITALRHERGRVISFEYVDGKVAVATSSDGRRIEYSYSAAGLLTEAKGSNYHRRYMHNEQGLIEVVADAAGVQEVVNTYDQYGRVISQKTPHGRLVRFSYLPGRVTVVADEDGQRSNSWISDAKGRLVGVIDAHDHRQSMSYDRKGNLVSVTERDGSMTVHAYDKRGRRTRTVTPEGSDITFAWDEQDRITDVVTTTGGLISYSYEGQDRNPCKIRDALGGITHLTWESGLLTGVVGPTGVPLSFTYDSFGDLTSVTNAYGDTARMVYDQAGRAVEAISPGGYKTRFTYDAAGQVVGKVDPDGATHRYEYDTAGRLVAIVDPAGERTSMRYGAHGQVAQTIDPLGRSVSREFDDMGNVSAAILPDGASWGFEHDSLSRLVAITDPAGSVWSREYDQTGQLAATVDPLGNRVTASLDRADQRITLNDIFGTATITTDAYGRPVKRENLDGSVELTSYDLAGNPVELVDGEGALTRCEYDLAGRLVAVINPDGARVSYEYDDAGRAYRYIDASGAVTELVYDADSRVVAKVNPAGERSEYEYDACGRLVRAVSPGRGVARYGYDVCGRLTFMQDGSFGIRRFKYDAAGQLVQAINGLGGRTRYEYDLRGRMVRMVDPAGGVTTRTYTQLDKVDSVTDALGRVTQATYDAAGHQLSQTDPTGRVTSWTYDSEGRETSMSVNGRLVSSVERDFAQRKVRVHEYLGDSETVHELQYDRVGRLLSRSRGESTMRWSYDVAGKLLSRVDPVGGSVEYSYDGAGRLESVADSDGRRVVYNYDVASRVVSTATEDLVSQWTYANGAVVAHRLVDGQGKVAQETSISRDEFGRVAGVERIAVDGTSTYANYGYDDASQLVSVHSSTTGRESVRYEYDECGRLVRTVGADGTDQVLAYDAASQLVSVTGSDGLVREFVYDGLGRRVRETDPDGSVREFAYGPAGYLEGIRVSTGAGESIAHSIRVDALGEIAQIDGIDLFWDSTAPVPTLVSVAGESLGLAPATGWRLTRSTDEVDPFAVPGAGPDTSGEGGLLAGFGLSADGVPLVAGVELMGARGYDPGTASFLSVDPLAPVAGAAWGSNPYSFAGNNPVNQVDPWGLRPITDAELADYQKAHQGVLADAGDFLGDNWEYLAVAGMVIAGGVLMATGVGGPVGLMLVQGGISVGVQKAITGSVDPVQLALDMVPGGPAIQTVCGAGSAVYSYMRQPGPHNVSGLLGDVTVAAVAAVLPGPSSAGKKLVGEAADSVVSQTSRAATDSVSTRAVQQVAESSAQRNISSGIPISGGYSPGKLEYLSSNPVLDPGLDLAGMSAYEKGKLGTKLAVKDIEARGDRILSTEVTFDVDVPDIGSTRVRLDAVAARPDGTIFGVEAKLGPKAKFTTNQLEAYPHFLENNVTPRGAKADLARQAGAPLKVGKETEGFPIEVHHFFPDGYPER